MRALSWKAALTGSSWFLYFIECRDGSVYTGTTTDVASRYEKHATGRGARYTRMNPPVRLLGFVAVENRSAALSAELRVKRMSTSAKREWIASNAIVNDAKP
ncbi:MAG TPA: GIY-YIG nuclease family protein [Rudaea sp.]|jgi:putative endonuclease|nr:GIY-YIG nuclease family protein [Rudaea sp.]